MGECCVGGKRDWAYERPVNTWASSSGPQGTIHITRGMCQSYTYDIIEMTVLYENQFLVFRYHPLGHFDS